jgi:hypothetical protein
MEAARVARATAVAVLTGSTDAEALRVAGADVVLRDLTAFPGWLDGWWPQASRAAAGPGLDDETCEGHREPDRAEQRQRRDRTGRGALPGPDGQGHPQGQEPDEEDHGAGGDEAAGAAVLG